MADNHLRKLKRGDLLELLMVQGKENEDLKRELEAARRESGAGEFQGQRREAGRESGDSEEDETVFLTHEDCFHADKICLKEELERERYRKLCKSAARRAVYVLITVAASAVLAATLLLPILRIYGNSMSPTLGDGHIVVSLRWADLKQGDIAAFYSNNKILVKRVIAGPGDWVDIDESGAVYVNGEKLEEPYVVDQSRGECSIALPCQVPDNRFFLMGDHRSLSVDSRSSEVGCVEGEKIVGKLFFCVWPLEEIGVVR